MAVPCILLLPLGTGFCGGVLGHRVISSTSSTFLPTRRAYLNLCVRASKKTLSTSTSELERTRGLGRQWFEAEMPVPCHRSRGKGGGSSPFSKKNGESISTTTELNISVAPFPGPKPPAGFILDEEGIVVLVGSVENRVITIVDPSSHRPLECIIRRAFQSSDGRDCLLLLPLDLPVQILKIDEEREGLTELSDQELQEILPSAIYALAKRRLHLIVSGFCLTARGGFCYTEEHVLDFKAEYGEGLGGSLTEGVEIANFQVGFSEYIVYTPFDPVMFVVHRDEATGQLKIADNELLDDEIVLDAIDEENEFQALVDEEDAIHDTLREAK